MQRAARAMHVVDDAIAFANRHAHDHRRACDRSSTREKIFIAIARVRCIATMMRASRDEKFCASLTR